MSEIVLEVCVEDLAGLAAAVAGGANRIELCAGLDLGGLTPGPGLMEGAAGAGVPVLALIRPRPGDFHYGADDLAACLADIRAARQAGLAGVVIGAARDDGTLDRDAIGRMIDAAGDMDLTLHRVFDMLPDRGAGLETAISMGIGRILTSGGARTAPDGRDEIARLIALAAGRIEVMPGSGVTAENVGPLVSIPGFTSVHASCRGPSPAVDDPFGFGLGGRRTDVARVRALRAELDRLG